MRIYIRYHKSFTTGLITKQSFITFKPMIDNLNINKIYKSSIINNLINNDKYTHKNGYGVANYIKQKIWIAPYGNQLEFVKILNDNSYEPFLTTCYSTKGILHYIGYYPEYNFHQLYYYFGNTFDDECMDTRLKSCIPDYFGNSLTFDEEWNVIKQNSYAIRVPYIACSELLHKEFEIKLQNVEHVNISYRTLVDNLDIENKGDMTVSYLLFKN